jgi:PAS domain S-box-containing protein
MKEIKKSFKSGSQNTVEIKCNDSFYSFVITPIIEEGYANMYGRDITESKMAQEKLKESEERFKVIAETTPVGIGVIDSTEGKFLYINSTYEKKFGYQKGELLGKSTPEIYWDTKDRDRILLKLKETGYVADYEVKLKRKDGTSFFGMSSVRPIAFGGKPALLGVFVDITERKAFEYTLEKNTLRHEILSDIASKLLESDNPQKIINEICMTVMEFLECHVFFNFLVDEKVGKLHLNTYHGIPERTAGEIAWLDFGVAVCGCVARDGERIIAENIPDTPDVKIELVKSFGIKAYCCHPLISQGKVIGTLSFGTKSRPTFSKDEISLMKAVTDQVAIAMNRVKSEKDLFDTKNYLESLISYANAPIIVWDPQNKIQLFNNAFANMTGYSSEEVIGKKIDFLFPEETLEFAKEKIGQSLLTRWESVEIPILCKNNEVRTILWNSANIYDIDNQTLISTIAQGHDITTRRKVMKQLEESQEKLELALENASIGVWVWDILTNAIEWDERMERIFGLEPGSFGKNYDAFEACLIEEDIPHTRSAIKKALEEEVPFETVYRIHFKDKDVKYINAKALLTKNKEGKAVKMTGVCFDITEMKKGAEQTLFKLNEDLLRSNKDLEQFAYVASHDLQEPLRMVSSFTQLLSQRYSYKLDKNAHEFIQFAVDGAARMQTLINDLLTFSRVQTRGKDFSNVDMYSVLGNVINYLQLRIQEKNALVTNDELPTVSADEGQMIQLLQNLVGNAIKFSGKMPVIHITSKEEKDYFIFSVKDNGIGIEPQYFDRIFQIFQRLHPKEEYSGTGIGLAICKRIVERHGGKIWVESELGLGTTFYFTILKNHIL